MSFLSKAVKSVSTPVKKVANVAIQTGVGFATGGNVGAVYGTAKGIKDNTKTGKAKTLNLRTIGQTAAGAAIANVAAGAVATGFHAAGAAGLGAKIAAIGKGGGLVGNLTKALPSALSLLGKGAKNLIPGSPATASDIADQQTDVANQSISRFRNIRDQVPNALHHLSSFATNIRGRSLGNADAGGSEAGATPGPTIVTAGMGDGINMQTILIVAVLLAIMFALKKR